MDWSPDGTRLLYSEIAPDHSYADVYAVELATGERQLVLENVLKAVWLPDGRRPAIVSACRTMAAVASGEQRAVGDVGMATDLNVPVRSPTVAC